MALFSDDLQDCDKQIKAIKYKNVGLQGGIHAKDQKIEIFENTINHLRQRYVDHAKNPGLVNAVMVVRIHTYKDR